MRILMFSWKDLKNPAAGGAEVFTWQILQGLVSRGHSVTLFTSRYDLSTPSFEKIEGVEIYRAGGRFGVYPWAIYYYFKYFRGKFDVVVDQINTAPFFTPFYVKEKRVAFIPQLARTVWFYETRFPFSLIGYILEPVFLQAYRWTKIVTISQSSFNDLRRWGQKHVEIIPIAISPAAVESLAEKTGVFGIAFLGRLVPGKRALDALEAFALVKKSVAGASMIIMGRGTANYQSLLENKVRELGIKESVEFRRNATDEERNEVLKNSHLILVPSIKEGWGLIVTEANSQGTPAVVYNVDGLRDSVVDGVTGLICSENTPVELARLVLKLYEDRELYERIRRQAWEWSKEFSVERAVDGFEGVLKGFDP